MSEHKCPCCGQQIDGEVPAKALASVPLRPTARRIIDALASVYPRGLSARQIADRVYADDPNGGPESAEDAMSVHMHRARPIIQGYGWTVGASGKHGNIRLQRIEG
jgi:hypothetical protein